MKQCSTITSGKHLAAFGLRRSVHRRYFVSYAGSCVSLVGLAGCLGGERGYTRPDDEPASVPAAFVCETDGFERHDRGYADGAVRWGETDDYELRVSGLAFEYGDTATIRLSPGVTGNRDKWNFEIYTEQGWTEVRGTAKDDAPGYSDEAVTGGHTWRIELTETGIVQASRHDDALGVCPDLVTGRYRFVYWGLGDESLAVAFDLTA